MKKAELKELVEELVEQETTIERIIKFAHENMEIRKASELVKMVLDYGFESQCQGYSSGYDEGWSEGYNDAKEMKKHE